MVKVDLSDYRITKLFEIKDALDILFERKINLYDEILFNEIYNDITNEIEKRAYK